MTPVLSAEVPNAIPTMTALTAGSISESMMKNTGDMRVDKAKLERLKYLMLRTVFFRGAV